MNSVKMSVVVVASLSGSAFAVVTGFTDQGAWEAAAGGPAVVDDLSSYGEVTLTLGSNSFFNGYSVDLDGVGTGGANVNSGGTFVFTVGGDLDSLTFDFDAPILGFGGSWLNTFVTNGLSLTIDGQTLDIESFVPTPDLEIVGFASDTPYSQAEQTVTDPGGASEFAALTDVLFVVPTPASAALLGMGGLAMARRRR